MVWTPYHSVNRIFESVFVSLILIKQIGWCLDYYAIFIQVLLSRHAHGRKVLIECRNKILILHQFFILITSMWAGLFTTNHKIHFKWCADLFLIEICFKKLTLKEQKRQYNRISIAAVSYGGDFIWHVTRCLSIFHWYFRNKQINPNKILGIFFSFHPWLRVLGCCQFSCWNRLQSGQKRTKNSIQRHVNEMAWNWDYLRHYNGSTITRFFQLTNFR